MRAASLVILWLLALPGAMAAVPGPDFASAQATRVIASALEFMAPRTLEEVGIPRPRDRLAVRTEPRFAELSLSLWRQLYEEVRAGYGR